MTNDGATILKSIGVDNPAAKILVGERTHPLHHVCTVDSGDGGDGGDGGGGGRRSDEWSTRVALWRSRPLLSPAPQGWVIG